MPDLAKVHGAIDHAFPDHLRRTQDFLRLRSVSGESEGLIETAHWLQTIIETLGGHAELAGNPAAPIVFGKFDVGKPKTLLVYGMYDVQTVAGQAWISDPFGAEIGHVPAARGPCIIARGACNSKGPLMGFLNSIQACLETDGLPVNLVLTIEGEEELGSPNLPQFYAERKEDLRADAGFEPFWAEYGTDVRQPVLGLGTKGVISLELICHGGDWGGPVEHDVHSSVGGWLASPAWRLIRALDSLLDEAERIAIDGFYNDVAAPSEVDEVLLKVLGETFDLRQTLEMLGARRLKYDLPVPELLRQYLYSPTLHLGRLTHGEGDVLAPEARVQLVIRLVPNMKPETTIARVREHLAKRGFGDIQVNVHSAYPWSRTNLNAGVVQSMLASYRYHGVEPQVWPILASATPYYLFSDVLGLPYVSGGLGRAGGSHAPNEWAEVEGLKLFEKSVATFLNKFAPN